MGKSDSKIENQSALGKRSTTGKQLPTAQAPAIEDSILLNKVRNFKQNLSSTKFSDVAYNASILYKLLKQLSSYHSRTMDEIFD